MDKLVSVVMTVRNCYPFIEEALSSINDQTFKDFEVIVYDDGSDDDTDQIISKMASDFPVPLILRRSYENKGVGFGRNEAIKYSSGKYIAIQDGDDISFPDRLQKEVEYLESHPSLFCVSGGMVKIDELGKETEKSLPKTETGKEIIKRMLKGINPIVDPACMFRKEIFLQLGQYSTDPCLVYVPDWDLWCKAALKGHDFYNLREFLVRYRSHPNSNCVKHFTEVMRQHSLVYKNFCVNFPRPKLKEIFVENRMK